MIRTAARRPHRSSPAGATRCAAEIIAATALAAILGVAAAQPLHAATPDAAPPTLAARVLTDTASPVVLEPGIVSLTVPPSLRFFPAAEVVEIFPDFDAEGFVGVVQRADRALDDLTAWWITVRVRRDGHVPMTPLPDLNTLTERHSAMFDLESEVSVRQHGGPIRFVRWLPSPRLDPSRHVLTWGAEIELGEGEESYRDVHRVAHVYGRTWTVVFRSDVSSLDQRGTTLPMAQLVQGVTFRPGKGYVDATETDEPATFSPADDLRGVTDAAAADLFDSLDYRRGPVSLAGGVATLDLPEAYRFLDAEDTHTVLVDIWDNSEDLAEDVLGMVVPVEMDPHVKGGWGAYVRYHDLGYVDEAEGLALDPDALLARMQVGYARRQAAKGVTDNERATLVGWARPPAYDAERHALTWARELRFGGEPATRLSYQLMLLGRRGTIVWNASADMEDISDVRAVIVTILDGTRFREGERYEDYRPGYDTRSLFGLTTLSGAGTFGPFGLPMPRIGRRFLLGLLVAVLLLAWGIFLGFVLWWRSRRTRRTSPTSAAAGVAAAVAGDAGEATDPRTAAEGLAARGHDGPGDRAV